MKRLKKIIPLIIMSLVATVLLSSAVYASTWEYRYPIYVTDTSGADRTNVPVLLGFGGQNLVNANKILASGLDTNMQSGVTDVDYMMSTTQVTSVIPSLPAGGRVQLDLYTGYSPLQTSFPIITGEGGYVTTSDHTTIEIGDDGAVSFDTIYLDTTVNSTIFEKPNAWGAYTLESGNVSLRMYGGSAINYPYVSSNTTGNGSAAYVVPTLPPVIASDLLIFHLNVRIPAGAAPTFTTPAGWEQLFNGTYTAGQSRYACWYRVATTAGNSANFTFSGAGGYVYQVLKIPKGYYSGVPVAGIFQSNTTGNADPPNLTSGFGAEKTTYFSLASVSSSTYTFTAAPADYIGFLTNTRAAESIGIASSYRQVTAASENPGTFTNSSTYWAANTIAIKGYSYLETTHAVTASEKANLTASVNATSGKLELWMNGALLSSITRSGNNVTNNANAYQFGGNGTPYFDSVSVTVNGTRRLYYAPNDIISGTTLPDRDATNGLQNGTITWGTNSNLTITYGSPESSSSYYATANATSGFTMPSAAMPSTWFSAGEGIASLPFYDMINQAATNAGVPAKTIYAWIIIGLAFCAFVSVIMYTRSAFMAVLAMSIVFFIGSSMTIIPMWIPFVILITDFGIMYLVKQVSY